jgi:uncharacterized protein (TIGR03435 family)
VWKIVAIAVVIVGSSVAQTPDASPQFEVASIKPSPPSDGRGMSTSRKGGPGTDDPGLLILHNWFVFDLIASAYQLQEYQLSGPDWMLSDRFDMSAKIPPGTNEQQYRLMMQNFLAERFKLEFHREKKQMASYNLVVGKNGPRLEESPPAVPTSERGPAERPPSGPPKRDADGYPILPPGREPRRALIRGYWAQRFADETMASFAEMLSVHLRQPVIDATGLSGKYDFTLRWVMTGYPAVSADAGPDLARAIQDQLGLKLESKKSMVEILVVDHINRVPTEN